MTDSMAWGRRVALPLLLLILSHDVAGKIIERIVARVNDEVITLTELNAEIENIRTDLERAGYSGQELERRFEKEKSKALENLIQTKLLLQRARELGFTANIDVEVSAIIENIRKENKIPNMETLERVLSNQGITLQAFRENIARQLIINRFLSQFVYSRIVVTGEEIEKYYNENKDKPPIKQPDEVEVSEIFLSTEGKDEKEVEAKARQLIERLKKGEDFAGLAKAYSEGATAKDGGALGTFQRGRMAPEIEKIAFALNEGQFTPEPIKTKYGFQILKVTRKRIAHVRPLSEVRDYIRDELYKQKTAPELNRFIEQLKKESYIYVYPEEANSQK